MSVTKTFKSKKCFYCGKASTMTVLKYQYDKWQSGMFVQDAFPTMSADDREILITGIHPACWDAMSLEDD